MVTESAGTVENAPKSLDARAETMPNERFV